jgi:hypothetical protein
MKIDLKPAVFTYIIWTIMSYLLMSFYVWDFDPGDWDRENRNVTTLFGPIFGIFIFLAVAFWRQAMEEESREI